MIFLKILGCIAAFILVKFLLQKYLGVYMGTYGTEDHQHFYVYTAREGMLLKGNNSGRVFLISGVTDGVFSLYDIERNEKIEDYDIGGLVRTFKPVKK
jgi:hypothetical protein